jgi:G3E family GTPase
LRYPRRAFATAPAFKYQARRPFDPARLAATLESGWTGVLRIKGFVWIASRGEE